MHVHEVHAHAPEHAVQRRSYTRLRRAPCLLVETAAGQRDGYELTRRLRALAGDHDRPMPCAMQRAIQRVKHLFGAAHRIGTDVRKRVSDAEHRKGHGLTEPHRTRRARLPSEEGVESASANTHRQQVDASLDAWETQLRVAEGFLPHAPDEAVARAGELLRAARAALVRSHGSEQLAAFVVRAHECKEHWDRVLAAREAETTAREHTYREREQRALTTALSPKL